MVISFSVKEARDQLLNKGFVYTFRWTRRAFFERNKGSIEYTWANEKRGKKKIADVIISEIGNYSCDNELSPFTSESGFKNTWDWQVKILEQANPHGNIDGWLYGVTVYTQTRKEGK